ncbi:MAG: thioredoxin, partial [Planctomycetia bacterium]|nr:thioredoxin [Planctomycetia bacterium]
FYTANDHESLIARTKDPVDGVLPGCNSVAVRNLVALAAATGEARYLDAAGKALDAFSARLAQTPSMMPLMLVALEEYLDARPAAAAAGADTTPLGPIGQGSQGVVAVKVERVDPVVLPGHLEFQATVSLTVKDGWHVYANPPGVEGVSPTRVTVDEPKVNIVKVVYPPGVAKVLASSGKEKVGVYEGKVTITVRFADARGPGASHKETVRFQACNDRACLAPAAVPVTVTVPVPLGR